MGVIITAVIYLLVVVLIGYYSSINTKRTPEDYYMASRSFGPWVLLFAVFATNQTAFGILGIPATAYKAGIGTYGYAGTVLGLTALGYYLIGYRCWLVGKAFGYITPPQILKGRWNSSVVSTIYFLLVTYYTVPYLMIGVIGGGAAFEQMTGGLIPYWLGALLVTVVVLYYVLTGGMRATAWTNVFQGLVFTIFFIIALMIISSKLGGMPEIFGKIKETNPNLLQRSGLPPFAPKAWFSFFLQVGIAAVMFPHLQMRLMASKDVSSLKFTAAMYPVIYTVGWLPAILIGLMAIVAIPGLTGTAVDNVVPAMLAQYLPGWMVGIGLAGVLAAVMSSLDGQILTLGTMLSVDVMDQFRQTTPETEVKWGRIFVAALCVIAFIGAFIRPATILDISNYSFAGYASLLPIMLGLFYWKRANKYGAIAAMIVSFILIQLYYGGVMPAWATFGFLPFIPILILTAVVFVVVSLVTTSQDNTTEFFDVFERAHPKGISVGGVSQSSAK